MSESSGEIHGIISREDAWRMWKPYGERDTELSSEFDPRNDSNKEIFFVYDGATEADRDLLNRYAETRTKEDFNKFCDLLAKSNKEQTAAVGLIRQRTLGTEHRYVKRLARGVVRLAQEGLFTPQQSESIQGWLWGPDGNPYSRHLYVTPLEYARLCFRYDNEYPSKSNANVHFYVNGTTVGAIQYGNVSLKKAVHGRVHESVHAMLSGLEIYDTTRVDGLRYPQASMVGTFASPVTTEIVSDEDYSNCENYELNEGWTEFIARELMRVEPKLGKPAGGKDYEARAKVVRKLVVDYPQLYGKITEVSLIDDTSTTPNAKREAISDLHAYADRVLEAKNSLTKLFQTNGGRLLDIRPNGRNQTDERR